MRVALSGFRGVIFVVYGKINYDGFKEVFEVLEP
jgi:hypothetical protein